MKRPESKLVFGASLWFSFALGIYIDHRTAANAVEQDLADARAQVANTLAAESLFETVFWKPRIHTGLILPLLAAGFSTLFGYWRIGCFFGVPSVATAAAHWWRWHEFYTEVQRDLLP